jgi:speckle-type POZ protein
MKSKLYSRPPATFTFSELGCHGYQTFVRRIALGKHLKHDCFALRVNLFIIKDGEPSSSIALPPSDMHLHLGDLLSRKEHTDVEFRVGEETFAAHRLLLGARSPIFKAELSGDRKTARVIQVDDMEPQVFKAMLTFIYTDTWPKQVTLQKESAMAQRLLVAADRYGLQRLKSMCEYRLSNHIDLDSVEDILLLAEKHQCAALKEACFDFIGSTATLLRARESILTLRRTQELRFDGLISLCPAITKDQIFNVLDHEPNRNSVGGINVTLDIE